jgi:hypothetical protein
MGLSLSHIGQVSNSVIALLRLSWHDRSFVDERPIENWCGMRLLNAQKHRLLHNTDRLGPTVALSCTRHRLSILYARDIATNAWETFACMRRAGRCMLTWVEEIN